jgi:ribosome-associated toxin RatA of RatAB toxin-antitoxin module
MFGKTRLGSFAAAAAILALSFGVRADSETDSLVERKASHKGADKYEVAPPKEVGTDISFGGGKIVVNAPIAMVRQVIGEYDHYQEIMPRFQKSRVVGKKEGKTDVYLQVPILHGLHTLWAVTRFAPPTRDGDGERIEGAKVVDKGNLKDLRAVWRLRPLGDDRTILKLELLIVPDFPAPGGLVTHEAKDAAAEAVTAVSDRAEMRFEKQKGAAQASDSDD